MSKIQISFVGNLGSDPEIKWTAKGSQVAQFNVAHNSKKRDADGEYIEKTNWFTCRVSGYQVEYVGRFTKGNRVLVYGTLEISTYTAKDSGEIRTAYDVWVTDVQNMTTRDQQGGGGRDEDTDSSERSAPASRQPVGAGAGAGQRTQDNRGRRINTEAADLEDLPF